VRVTKRPPKADYTKDHGGHEEEEGRLIMKWKFIKFAREKRTGNCLWQFRIALMFFPKDYLPIIRALRDFVVKIEPII